MSNRPNHRESEQEVLNEARNESFGTIDVTLQGVDSATKTNTAPITRTTVGDKEAVDVNIAGGSSSGTQYTEGDTDASVTGTAVMWKDAANTLAVVSAAKPLPVTASIDTTGLATTTTDTNTGTIAGDTTSIDGKTPALGQALEAASVPVVLPATQITTLTPPAAITGFATSSNQIDGSQKTQIVNSAGADLELVKQADNFNAAYHGIVNFGLDDGTPQKYKQIKVDTDGRQTVHPVNVAHDEMEFDNLDYDTGGGTDNISVLGIALPGAGGAVIGGTTTNPVNIALPSATVTTLTPPAAITNFANETGGNLAAIKGKTDNIPALGQALAAASVPVILPTATITTLTPPAAITGFATSAKQLADNHQVTVSNIASTPLVNITTLATSAKQLADNHQVTANLSATDNAVLDTIDSVLDTINAKMVSGTDIGDVTINNAAGAAVYTQPGTSAVFQTQSNSANIATETTLALIKNTDGIKKITDAVTVNAHAVTNAGTFAVQNTDSRPSSSAVTQVSSSASNVTLKASNANRRGLTIQNDSTAILYVKFGATASTTSYTVKMVAGAYYEVPNPCYTGIVDGIWASSNGNAYITETT